MVVYLNKMGGCSFHLNHILQKIIMWAEAHNVLFTATHVAGVANGPVDYLSCLHPQHEWSMSPTLFQQLEKRWGLHTVDCFVLACNTQLPRFNSRFSKPGGKATDALAQLWTHNNNWAAPPIALIPRVIWHMQRQRATATIITPVW